MEDVEDEEAGVVGLFGFDPGGNAAGRGVGVGCVDTEDGRSCAGIGEIEGQSGVPGSVAREVSMQCYSLEERTERNPERGRSRRSS
jgi:hypothetical protein